MQRFKSPKAPPVVAKYPLMGPVLPGKPLSACPAGLARRQKHAVTRPRTLSDRGIPTAVRPRVREIDVKGGGVGGAAPYIEPEYGLFPYVVPVR